MKPETQVKIGRRTALVLIFLLLIFPPLFVYDKIQIEQEEVNPQQALLFLGLMYMFMLPLVLILGGFAWVLRRNKQKTAIILFVIYTIWCLLSAIVGGIGVLLIEFLTIFLLLQGILGIRKLQTSIAVGDDE